MCPMLQLRVPPVIAAPNVVKLYQSLAKPYINLAHTFERDDLNMLKAEVDAARDVWVMVCYRWSVAHALLSSLMIL